jgi:tetratricopeptide (TPR) repeat protein
MEAKTLNKKLHFLCLVLGVTLHAAPLQTQKPESQYREAVKALGEKHFQEALSSFEQAISLDPDNARYANDYRQAAIQAKEFDRALKFFEKLLTDHPNSANLHLNFGFAHVDKIPIAGSITQVILANSALTEFTRALELQPTWIGYYTRGESYLFWPKIFNRAPMGVADLEKALDMQQKTSRQSYHVKVYIALGDGYWKTDQLEKAKATWTTGLKEFPSNTSLKGRLSAQGDDLKNLIEAGFDPAKRVNTDLSELWPN